MNLRPWDLWTHDGKPQPGTESIVATLERSAGEESQSSGANHFYIHAVEASPFPDRGLPSAERLPGLMPAAGHMVHMPAHIYLRLGRYRRRGGQQSAHGRRRSGLPREVQARGRLPHDVLSAQHPLLVVGIVLAGAPGRCGRGGRGAERPADRRGRARHANDRGLRPHASVHAGALWHVGRYPGRASAPRGFRLRHGHVALRPRLRFRRDGPTAQGAARVENPARGESRDAGRPVGNAPPDGQAARDRGRDSGRKAGRATGTCRKSGPHLEQAVAVQDALQYERPPPWYYPVRQSLGRCC